MAKPAVLLILAALGHALVPPTIPRTRVALQSTQQDSVIEKAGKTGMLSAAAVAAAAVNQAVSMTTLDAPDVGRSYVALRDSDGAEDDETGLPLSYDKDKIQAYWLKQGKALQQRWGEFLRLSVPFLLKTATLLVQGGVDALQENDAELARDARVICEQLGPTFIKLAQTLSVRPDVLPPAALAELAVLQDSVMPFETSIAIDIIEKEPGHFFCRDLGRTGCRRLFSPGLQSAARRWEDRGRQGAAAPNSGAGLQGPLCPEASGGGLPATY